MIIYVIAIISCKSIHILEILKGNGSRHVITNSTMWLRYENGTFILSDFKRKCHVLAGGVQGINHFSTGGSYVLVSLEDQSAFNSQ